MKSMAIVSAVAALMALSPIAAGAAPTAADQFHVVGEGIAMFYDGVDWHTTSSGSFPTLYDVCGTSNSNVYAVGEMGGYGVIYHYNGSAWTGVTTVPSMRFWGVWGNGDGLFFAVGEYGTTNLTGRIYYSLGGGDWNLMIETPGTLKAVWGSAFYDVYAAGMSGAVWHFDGGSWTQIGSDQSACDPSLHYTCWEEFNSIWGVDGSDVYFAGSRARTDHSMVYYAPLVERYVDGATWASFPDPADPGESGSSQCLAIWGTSASNIYTSLNCLNGGVARYLDQYDGSMWLEATELARTSGAHRERTSIRRTRMTSTATTDSSGSG